ncbi:MULTISPECIES: minor capsid protein [unclassified Egicoccus]|uniref:minor capsid protein n=1 Tax=unclassified Egicoccus TaxID=2635606 RepID=UPI00359EFC42
MTRMSLNWRGAAIKAAGERGAERGLALAAEHLLEEANRHVPIEEGTLMRSGTTQVDGLEAAVSYDTPYAIVQHERLDYTHASGRTAKYLERPAMSERDVIAKLIQREIAAALSRGGGLL